MFAADSPVSEEALRRMRAASRAGSSGATTWSQVPSPSMDAALASLRRPRFSGPHEGLPRVEMLSTSEDIRATYPSPPTAALGHMSSTGVRAVADTPTVTTTTTTSSSSRPELSSAAVAQAGKRARADAGTAQGPASTEDSGRTAPDDGPTVAFESDYPLVDYMGRSFLVPPAALVQAAGGGAAGRPCQPPQAMRGLFKPPASAVALPQASAGAAGIQLVRWAPPAYGHLLFAAGLRGEVRLWESQGARRPIACFRAHTQPVKSMEVTSLGEVMSTGSVDGTAVLWDVEAGACKAVLTNPEKQQVVQHCHHPSDEDSLVLVAVDRRVVLYDIRASHAKAQREYAGHMGAILNLTLLSGGTKFLTTAEDRTLRTWDFRIPVQIKQFADANMHAITHVVHHPSEDFLAAQSLDNKVAVFQDGGAGRLTLARQREFTGHTTSGTRCQLAFSRDGQYLSSGDIEGGLYLWRWATGELVKTFKAHSQMLVSHQWHPLEPSRIVTGAWDGHIKNWV